MGGEWVYAGGFVGLVLILVVIGGRAVARYQFAQQQRDDADMAALRAENTELRRERDHYYTQAVEAERQAAQDRRLRTEAERQMLDERRMRIDAERAVANADELFRRFDEMQAELVKLRAEVHELKRARSGAG